MTTTLFSGDRCFADGGTREGAVEIANGRFTSMGREDEVPLCVGTEFKKAELRGGPMIQGLTGAHLHPAIESLKTSPRIGRPDGYEGSAFVYGQEVGFGKIAPEYCANLVLLDRDPIFESSVCISESEVDSAWVDGDCVVAR